MRMSLKRKASREKLESIFRAPLPEDWLNEVGLRRYPDLLLHPVNLEKWREALSKPKASIPNISKE